MKQKFLTLILVLTVGIGTLSASNTSVGGIWYDFNSSTKTATVTYRGSADVTYLNEYSGSVVIPSSVTYNGTTYSVVSIGEDAFRDCSSLTSVTIPNSVTIIGDYAFWNCSSLTSINVDSNNPNYSSVDGVLFNKDKTTLILCPEGKQGAYIIPNSVTSIGIYAFTDCKSLSSVTIPNSVTSIGDRAFYWCSSLTSITIPNSVTIIGDYAFRGCSSLTSMIIPNSVTSIGGGAFYQCSSLTSITIPNSVTIIGDYAFWNCSSLTSVTIPNSVTSIEIYAFQGCTSLTSVTIPESVTSIGEGAFSGCSSLTSVTFEGVTSPTIGKYVFNNTNNCPIYVPCGTKDAYVAALNCYSTKDATRVTPMQYTIKVESADESQGAVSVELVSIVDDEKNRIYYTSSDDNIVTPYSATVFVANIVSNTYQDGLGVIIFDRPVVSIGEDAFRGCSSLTSMIIPNSVISIGWSAFQSCSSLTSITIPNSVTIIGEQAFEDCSSLTSITIPNSVTSIEADAFTSSSLTSIVIPNSVTSIDIDAFNFCSSLSSINVADDNPNYCSMDGVLFSKDKTTLILCPEGKQGAYIIPNSVTSIGKYAFERSSLASITIPNSVTSIGERAFERSSLASITIPNSVTSIGERAFDECSSLVSVTIGNSVTSIGTGAFSDCSSLISVTFKGLTPPRISNYVFNNTNNCPIYVPYGTKDAYVTALNVNNTIDASRVTEK